MKYLYRFTAGKPFAVVRASDIGKMTQERHDVLTPDGGIIECRNEASARRVADDMNALCAYVIELEHVKVEVQDFETYPYQLDDALTAFDAK
jgi:hypothetical protein